MAQEDFLKKCALIHDNKYDYSLVVYDGQASGKKIKILCSIHGEFEQHAHIHLRGSGCAECAWDKRRNGIDLFVSRARKIHGTKYDYSLILYKSCDTLVDIICPDHGVFKQTPYLHLKLKHGCPKCGGSYQKTTQDFINEASKIHNYKYDYSKVIYTNIFNKVLIICPIHGEFKQVARDHLRGHECRRCAGTYRDCYDFINDANIIHESKYDYSRVKYINVSTKVEIICPLHGLFQQTPNSHLSNKRGCPVCGINISKREQMWLDTYNIPKEYRHYSLKIEGYNRSLIVDAYNPLTNTIYEFYGDFWHGNPNRFKHDDINPVTKTTYGFLYEQTMIRHKKLSDCGYNIIFIWESEWKQLNNS